MTPRGHATGRALAALAAAAALVAAGPAAAWDNQGHMATGAIAYDAIARSRPDLVRAVVAIMAAHPDRARFERELGAAQGPARDRLLFEYMARWPDDVRRTPYDRPAWHYAVRIVSPPGALLTFHNGRAEEAYLRELAVARDPRAAPAERAVALCWVMHLVGDMHQPLHAGHWMSLRFPATDRAGTIAWVRAAPGAKPDELHLFWDRAGDQPGGDPVGRRQRLRPSPRRARPPRRDPRPSPPPPARAFDAWAASSRKLALDDGLRRRPVRGRRLRPPRPPCSPRPMSRGPTTWPCGESARRGRGWRRC